MTSPNDLMSEFQKLKAETNKINENFLDTTSTFGCSSESILLRKVLDELKSIKSKVVEIENQHEWLEKSQEIRCNLLQNAVLDELKMMKMEEAQLQNAHQEKLVELRKKQETLQNVLQNSVLRELFSIKTEMREVKSEQSRIYINTINESLVFHRIERSLEDIVAQNMKTLAQKVQETLQDVLQKTMHKELKVVSKELKKHFSEKSSEPPILESIVGTWKMVDQKNSKSYLKKCKIRESFYDDLKVSVNGEQVSIEYIQHPSTFNYEVGESGSWKKKVFIKKNHLKLWLRSCRWGPVHLKHDFFIKNCQLYRKLVDVNKDVECVRIYERIS